MADPFVGEVRLFAGNYAPSGWALCDGRLLSVSEYGPLFSLLGTTYGGDGKATFALPDLRGRAPLHQGQAPGLSARRLGEKGGSESVTLQMSHLPAHSHVWMCSGNAGSKLSPVGNVPASESERGLLLYGNTVNTSMAPTSSVGSGEPHENMQPWFAVSYIIALEGLYPEQG